MAIEAGGGVKAEGLGNDRTHAHEAIAKLRLTTAAITLADLVFALLRPAGRGFCNDRYLRNDVDNRGFPRSNW